jgi:hypothetical protein
MKKLVILAIVIGLVIVCVRVCMGNEGIPARFRRTGQTEG